MLDSHNLRTTIFAKKILETALSCWRDLEHSAASVSRRVSGSIHLRSFLGRSTPRQPSTARPNARDAAVKGDRALAENAARREERQKPMRSKAGQAQVKANREAIERGENEGMAVPSKEKMPGRGKRGARS